MQKIKDKFTVGSKGIHYVGGEGSTITEAPTFKFRENGLVEYTAKSERIMYGGKSATMGVGDTKTRKRTTVTNGVILKGGKISSVKNNMVEEITIRAERLEDRAELENEGFD